MSVSRRNFLKGAAAGSAGTVLAGGVLIGGARADGSTGAAPATPTSYPFHGTHQPGVLTPGPAAKQPFACFAAFDSIATSRSGLADLLRVLTERSRFLTSGGIPSGSGHWPAPVRQRRARAVRPGRRAHGDHVRRVQPVR